MEATADQEVVLQAEELAREALKHLDGEPSIALLEPKVAIALLKLVHRLNDLLQEHNQQLAGLGAPGSSLPADLRRLYCTALPAYVPMAGPAAIRLAIECLLGLDFLLTMSEQAAVADALWSIAVTVDRLLAAGDSEDLCSLRAALISKALEVLNPLRSQNVGVEPAALGPESPALLPLYRLALGALQHVWPAVAVAAGRPSGNGDQGGVTSGSNASEVALVSEVTRTAILLAILTDQLRAAWQERGGMDTKASQACCCAMAEALAGMPHSPLAGRELLYGAALRAMQSILRLQKHEVAVLHETGGACAAAGARSTAHQRRRRQQQQQRLEQCLMQQRRPWLQIVRFAALALHHAADGTGDHSINNRDFRALESALSVLEFGGELVCRAFVASEQQLGKQTGNVSASFPEEDVDLSVEIVEVLLRLAAKRAALDPLVSSTQLCGHAPPTGLMMAAWQLLNSLAHLWPSSSPGQAEVWLRQVQSLCATAAKLGRCLPSINPAGPEVEITFSGNSAPCRLSPAPLYQLVMNSTSHLATLAVTSANITAGTGVQKNLSGHLRCKCRKCGFLAFVCIPGLMQAEQAMHAAGELMPRDVEDDTPSLLKKLCDLRLMDLAVRGDLGGMLLCKLRNMLAGGSLVYASDFFVNYAVYCKRESGASLSMALVKNEVLATAVNGCYGLAEGLKSEFWHQNLGEDSSGSPNIPYDSDMRLQLLLNTALLLRAVCETLDAATDTRLMEQHAPLLSRVPSLDNLSLGAGQFVTITDLSWAPGFLATEKWERVRSELVPALVAACAPLVAGGEPLQNDIFREVSVATVCCCNPACTNMAGARETDVRLSPCGSCMEARYCSKSCQRADWQRHKPICIAIKELK